jgi:hypothetical protein
VLRRRPRGPSRPEETCSGQGEELTEGARTGAGWMRASAGRGQRRDLLIRRHAKAGMRVAYMRTTPSRAKSHSPLTGLHMMKQTSTPGSTAHRPDFAPPATLRPPPPPPHRPGQPASLRPGPGPRRPRSLQRRRRRRRGKPAQPAEGAFNTVSGAAMGHSRAPPPFVPRAAEGCVDPGSKQRSGAAAGRGGGAPCGTGAARR